MSIELLFDELLHQLGEQRRPPVQQWQPASGGRIDIRIDRDGYWFYEGGRISRDAIVRLFAGILRRDEDGYVLVTPVERLLIQVDDVPFVAVDFEVRGASERAPALRTVTGPAALPETDFLFTTNVGDLVLVDAAHPLWLGGDDQQTPYIRVRDRLDARIARAAYYRLLDHAVVVDETAVLHSSGTTFTLGSTV
ncbi:MAG: DUF1285 domain-containing protein [Pseudomonadales bacterium]